MTWEDRIVLEETRRHFFRRCGVGLGQIALASLVSDGKLFGASTQPTNPMAPKPPHSNVRTITSLRCTARRNLSKTDAARGITTIVASARSGSALKIDSLFQFLDGLGDAVEVGVDRKGAPRVARHTRRRVEYALSSDRHGQRVTEPRAVASG